MSDTAFLVACAIGLLGLRPGQVPPIEVIMRHPPDVSSVAEAFVRRNPDRIYVVGSMPVFRERRGLPGCGNREAVIKVASILAHELWHLKNGPDEQAAYEAQLTALSMLGQGNGTQLYQSVRKSMLTVIATRRR